MDLTTFTLIITPWAQLQFSTDDDRGDDLLRKGQASQLTADAKSPTPYWLAAQSLQVSPAAAVPMGHTQGWFGSEASAGIIVSMHTQDEAFAAPVPFVVRPEGQALQVA